MSDIRLHLGDCLEEMGQIADGSVDLVAVDPPYFKVKGAAWDRQWDNPAAFLAWVGRLCDEWCRVLAPNGSVYCFASPRMAWGVEGEIRKRFNVLQRIIWGKPAFSTKAEMNPKEWQRRYFPVTETIVFAEHFGFTFEPLRAYLDGERERAGVSVRQVAEAFQRKTGSRTVTGMAGHWFGQVQWALPTRDNYEWLRATLSSLNHDGEYLRRDYEELRAQYESLRRPFSVTADVPYTDVWDFPTVPHRPGKHLCEKPLAMMEHIIRASSREGATVLDCCMGSGTTGVACVNTGRNFIGIELNPGYFATAEQRVEDAKNAEAGMLTLR